MLIIKFEGDTSTLIPNADSGLITWWKVLVTQAKDGPGPAMVVATARAAMIHVSHALTLGEPLYDVLDADSAELEELYEVFFDPDREEIDDDPTENGIGDGMLYVTDLEISNAWRQRNADLAIVGRLAETIGMGCGTVVLEAAESKRAARWSLMGFKPSARDRRFQVLDRSMLHPLAVEADVDDRFVLQPVGPVGMSVDDE